MDNALHGGFAEVTETTAALAPSPAKAQIATAMRDAGLIVSASTAVLGFVRVHDLAGLVNYLQSQPAIDALAVAATVGIVIWRQWNARHTVHKLADAAK